MSRTDAPGFEALPSRRPMIRLLLALLAGLSAESLTAQQRSVVNTMHNLSVTGPGEIRSLSETEVCKFCHIPHNPVVPVPLWGHALSKADYEVPTIRMGGGPQPAPQPDGSSRLCLSCHDGTVALGDIVSEPQPIQMRGADRLRSGHRGFLGTDLSGSHPISFVVPDGDSGSEEADRDMALRPLSAIEDSDQVRLDSDGKMQCTTCHEAHSDQYYVEGRVPRFWVAATLEEVCLACHAPL